jgi:hypothetical protein
MAWAAFVKSGDAAFTYGDLVVLEDEINPVISKLEEKGLESRPSITICCMRRRGSCTSTSSDVAMRWN